MPAGIRTTDDTSRSLDTLRYSGVMLARKSNFLVRINVGRVAGHSQELCVCVETFYCDMFRLIYKMPWSGWQGPKKSITQNTVFHDTQRLSAVEIPTIAHPITLTSSLPKVLTLLPADLHQKDEGALYGNLQSSKRSLLPPVNPNKRITSHRILHPLHLSVFSFNPLKTKRSLLYLKTQSVPRCKHFSSRL